jgi:pimeloyl-ACP methyl ester carboxylesterase
MELEIIDQRPEGEARPTPIVFVHGAWHGAWCWLEHFVPYFVANGYRCVAFSLRGHGASPGHWRFAGMSGYVADLAQVTAGLDAPPIIIAHSMGGFILRKYLEKYSAAAAVLLASVPPAGVLGTTLRIASRHPLAFVKANLSLSLWPIVGTPALAREAFFSADTTEVQVKKNFDRLQPESFIAFIQMLLMRPRPKLDDVPVLVLGAADDTIFTEKEVDATAQASGVEATIFENMAHDMMLEPRWQAVADRIIDWLVLHQL